MRNGGYIGVRADKALRLLGEKGPMRMSALLCALGLRPQCSSFKYTVSKLVDAKILKVTGSADPIVSLADQAYADPACAREVYEAYKSGVRADKALEVLGEKGPLRMSALLDALGIRTQIAASFKITVSKLVDAGILSVTDDQDTLVSLTDQKYADPAAARDEYRAYNSEKKAEKKTETKAVIIPPVKRSMIEDIAFGMAEQGAKA